MRKLVGIAEMAAQAMAEDEPSVLEDGSLLNSLSDHHIFELLLIVKADAIARLRGTSHAIRAAVDLQMPSILDV